MFICLPGFSMWMNNSSAARLLKAPHTSLVHWQTSPKSKAFSKKQSIHPVSSFNFLWYLGNNSGKQTRATQLFDDTQGDGTNYSALLLSLHSAFISEHISIKNDPISHFVACCWETYASTLPIKRLHSSQSRQSEWKPQVKQEGGDVH